MRARDLTEEASATKDLDDPELPDDVRDEILEAVIAESELLGFWLTWWRLLADRTIPSVQIGHSRRIAVRALEDFVQRLHRGERELESNLQAVTGQQHYGRASHRSRRRKPVRSADGELLPLPFPQGLEEQ